MCAMIEKLLMRAESAALASTASTLAASPTMISNGEVTS
jgi:hypothetical protein